MTSWQSEVELSAAAAALVAEMSADPFGLVSVSVYESARVARLAPWLAGHAQRLRFLLDRQRPDGLWPGPDGYALVPTLSAVEALLASVAGASATGRALNRSPTDAEQTASATAGLRALARWFRPGADLAVPDTVAVELIVPALVEQINGQLARFRGAEESTMDVFGSQGLGLPRGLDDGLLNRLRDALRARRALPAKVAHSLEAFADASSGASFVRPAAGVVACSPAATAAWLGVRPDHGESVAYLAALQAREGGPVPVCAPVPVFERAWVLAAFASAGLPVVVPDQVLSALAAAVGDGGASTGGGLAPDADTTAMTLYVLARLDRPRSPDCLLSFRAGDHFTSFPAERTVSTSANAHVLQALGGYTDRRPDERDRYRVAMAALADWLCAQQETDGSWVDKWHASPYYATGCAVAALAEFGGPSAAGAIDKAAAWVLDTRRADGAWGRWQSTAEETAYAVRILIESGRADTATLAAAAGGTAFLLRFGFTTEHPPLWHDKDLYTPTRVVRAEVIAAVHRARRHPHLAPLLADPNGNPTRKDDLPGK